jgi:hypothetical protein
VQGTQVTLGQSAEASVIYAKPQPVEPGQFRLTRAWASQDRDDISALMARNLGRARPPAWLTAGAAWAAPCCRALRPRRRTTNRRLRSTRRPRRPTPSQAARARRPWTNPH